MEKWLYIKNASPVDGIALAAVLASTEVMWNVIHSTLYSCFLRKLENVEIGHPDEDFEILTIELEDTNSFDQKCNSIASQLGLLPKEEWGAPSFVKELKTELEKRINSYENIILLYFIPHPGKHIDLMLVDHAMRSMAKDGYQIIDGNSAMLPNIKGTKDFRGLINLETVLRTKDKIKVVVTTETWMKDICSLYGIKSICISDSNGTMFLDNITVEQSLQFANYIQNIIK